jgi:hypothetical protein
MRERWREGRLPRGIGFSLVEMLLAVTLLVLAALPILSLYFETNRLHDKLSGVFREAIAGQLVWETLKGHIAVNPNYLSYLAVAPGFTQTQVPHPDAPGTMVNALVHTGAFVPDHGPKDAQGRPIQLSVLIPMGLFTTTGPSCPVFGSDPGTESGAGATITADELKSLQHNYADLAFHLQINDGLLPQTAGGLPRVSAQVKEVIIDVYRANPDGRIPSTPAYHLDSALQSPPASLGILDLKELIQSRSTNQYQKDLDAARKVIQQTMSGSTAVSAETVDAAANLLIILVESAGDAMMVDGNDMGVGVPKYNAGHGLDYWAGQLLQYNTPVHQLLAGDLIWEKSQCVMRAYTRSANSINALPAYIDTLEKNLVPVINSLVSDLSKAESGVSTDASAATTDANNVVRDKAQQMSELAFWYQILANDQWVKAVERPLTYADQMRDSMSRSLLQYRTAEAEPNQSPLDKIRALNSYIEVVKSAKLYQNNPHIPEEGLILDRANDYEPCLPDYASVLRNNEALDFNILKERYAAYLNACVAMKALSAPGHPYRQVVKVLGNQGILQAALPRFKQALNYFGFTDLLSKMNGQAPTVSVSASPSTSRT